MADDLKNNEKDKRSLVPFRSFVASSLLSGSFSKEQLLSVMAELAKVYPEASIQNEISNANYAVEKGELPSEPSFSTPVSQFIWGAHIAYLGLNPDARKAWSADKNRKEFVKTPFWQSLISNNRINSELVQNAVFVSSMVDKKSTTIGWADAGSGVFHDYAQKEIKIDLAYGLVNGLEHTRASIVREVGRSNETHIFTPAMDNIRREIVAIQQQSKKREITRDEYKKMYLLSKEWELRYTFFKAADDNVANRFAEVMSSRHAQDYSYSLNSLMLSEMPLMRAYAENSENPAQAQFMTVVNTAKLGFFANSGLINNEQDLAAAGVKSENFTKNRKPEELMKAMDGDENSVSSLQSEIALTRGDKARGPNYIAAKMHQIEVQRGQQIDKLYDEFANDFAKEVLKDYEKKIEEELDKKQEEKQQNKDNQQNQNNQKQDGQDSQDGEQNQDGQQQEGQDGQSQDSQDGQEGQDGQDGQQQDGKQQQQKGQKGKEQKQDSKSQKGDKQQQQQGDSQQKQDKNKKDDKVDVKDVGEMPNVPEPKETPDDERRNERSKKDENKKDKEGKEDKGENGESKDKQDKESKDKKDSKDKDSDGKDSKDSDKSDSDKDSDSKDKKDGDSKDSDSKNSDSSDNSDQTVEDVIDQDQKDQKDQKSKEEELKQRIQEAQKDQDMKGQSPTLDDLPIGDFKDYNAAVAKLSAPIKRAEHIFKKIQEYQLKMISKKSKEREIIPEGGDFSRFDYEAEKDRIIKKKTGKQLEKKDYERFVKDDDRPDPANLDIFVWIDGSGSMSSGNPRPIDVAVQTGVILYEATKKLGMNVYVGMWGGDDPIMLASPGDNPKEIGERIDAAKEGLGCYTNLAPAVEKTAKTIADRKAKKTEKLGYTHMLVISDGDIFDESNAMDKLEAMFDSSKLVTCDIAVVQGENTGMHRLVENMKSKNPMQNIDIMEGFDSKKIASGIVDCLLKKIRVCKSMVVKESSAKGKEMSKALKKMNQSSRS